LHIALWNELKAGLAAEQLVVLATLVAGPHLGRQLLLRPTKPGSRLLEAVCGDLGDEELEDLVKTQAAKLLANFQNERRTFETTAGQAEVFLEVYPPRPRLIVVGAVHVAIPLVAFAKELGFRTIIVDPRTAFATPQRFPHADELHTDWPDEALRRLVLDENTFIALLSHDLKLDLAALEVALPSPARYIGALGSKKTHRKRVGALLEKGFEAAAIARIHNPIGLNLGGRRAEEIAVAIAAEIVAVNHGRDMSQGRDVS
jgi:xanthine dehydrogenase accessory factor